MRPTEPRVLPSVLLVLAAIGCGSASPEPRPPIADPEPVTVTAAPAPHRTHWGYAGRSGPSRWGHLERDWAVCGEGHTQSPIDLDAATVTELPAIALEYRSSSLRIVRQEHVADVVDTGHSIQVNTPDGGSMHVGDATYQLLQFHVHTPSEHTLHGIRFPMELHAVHRSADGRLAVLAVFVREGRPNEGIARITRHLPTSTGTIYHYENVRVDGSYLLPVDRTTYRYEGSLTKPPCTEGVQWIVFATPIEAAAEQIAAFRAIIGENARPTQARGDRGLRTDHAD